MKEVKEERTVRTNDVQREASRLSRWETAEGPPSFGIGGD